MNSFIHQSDNCRIVKFNATSKNRFSKVNTFQTVWIMLIFEIKAGYKEEKNTTSNPNYSYYFW